MGSWSPAGDADFALDALPSCADAWPGTQTNTRAVKVTAACDAKQLVRHVGRRVADGALSVFRTRKNRSLVNVIWTVEAPSFGVQIGPEKQMRV